MRYHHSSEWEYKGRCSTSSIHNQHPTTHTHTHNTHHPNHPHHPHHPHVTPRNSLNSRSRSTPPQVSNHRTAATSQPARNQPTNPPPYNAGRTGYTHQRLQGQAKDELRQTPYIGVHQSHACHEQQRRIHRGPAIQTEIFKLSEPRAHTVATMPYSFIRFNKHQPHLSPPTSGAAS